MGGGAETIKEAMQFPVLRFCLQVLDSLLAICHLFRNYKYRSEPGGVPTHKSGMSKLTENNDS